MINISGYLATYDDDILDTQNELQINSCGHYRLVRLSRFETVRTHGRSDFQLLYIAKGKAFFYVENERLTVSEGSCMLYFPGILQKYEYFLKDSPEIYWVHFTGTQAQSMLAKSGFLESGAFPAGASPEYIFLFNKIIEELQQKRAGFSRLCALYLEELTALMARRIAEAGQPLPREEIQKAVEYFNQNYHTDISIQDYAKSCGMSVSWFIRNFKEHIGVTPQKYITEIRISKAKELLDAPSLNIGEVAALTGYQNPLYFSRIFRQSTGVSPLAYKRGRL